MLLAGGNDSYNMLAPKGMPEWDQYVETRADLAIDHNQLLALNPITPIGKDLGAHPSMTGVQQLFDNQNLAFVANVGTLIENIPTATDYHSGNYQHPLGIYSHADQIQQWQTSIPNSREAVGWGGKMADLLKTPSYNLNTNPNISMNISLAGRNVFQAGNTVLEYSISNQGDGIEGIREPVPWWKANSGYLNRLTEGAIKDMATEIYANVFQETFADLTDQSLLAFEDFQKAISQIDLATSFSPERLAQDLRMIARVIGARDALGMCRQTFFVTIGGWDHHNEVIESQMYMLGVLSRAINEFMSALGELGVQDKVTLFTASDFARTLTSNGNGSDHAWGGNTIVAGGAVKGKEIYGSYPDLNIEGNDLIVHSRGNIIPTTSTDEYFAELALWFGVSPSDLPLLFPNIGNFYDINSGVNPLGFL